MKPSPTAHRWATCLLTLVLILTVAWPVAVAAQDAIEVRQQTHAISFGQIITFSLQATAPAPFERATLVVHLEGRTQPIIEEADISPVTDLSIAHHLDVEAHQIPPFAAITYHWELEDQLGNRLVTDEEHFRYEDTSLAWEWQTEQRDYLTVHYDGHDLTAALAALDVAEDAITRAERLLGVVPPDEVHIYIYPEPTQLTSSLRVHNLSIQDWVAAYALPPQSVVLVSASAGPELQVELGRDLPHELTHLLIYNGASPNAASVPGWFNEGLAIMASAEPDPRLGAALDEATLADRLLPLESLCVNTFAALPASDAALAYAQSESLMRYIHNLYGTAGVRNLMAAYADGAACDAGVQRALGLSFDALESDWKRGRQQAVRTASTGGAALPWLALWGMSLLVATLFVVPHAASRSRTYRGRSGSSATLPQRTVRTIP
jgi:hypothetical protein